MMTQNYSNDQNYTILSPLLCVVCISDTTTTIWYWADSLNGCSQDGNPAHFFLGRLCQQGVSSKGSVEDKSILPATKFIRGIFIHWKPITCIAHDNFTKWKSILYWGRSIDIDNQRQIVRVITISSLFFPLPPPTILFLSLFLSPSQLTVGFSKYINLSWSSTKYLFWNL